MKISFGQTYNRYAYPKNNNNADFYQKANVKKMKTKLLEDFGLSIGAGTIAGLTTAAILTKRKVPNVFINSLGIGTVFSYITYIGTLLTNPFRLK